MKNILKLEQLALFAFAFFLYQQLDFSWWTFWLFLLLPDISIAGYLINKKLGAHIYNFAHHQGVAIVIIVVGGYFDENHIQAIGLVLLAHSAMDRVFGFGLKYTDSFKNTHLGRLN